MKLLTIEIAKLFAFCVLYLLAFAASPFVGIAGEAVRLYTGKTPWWCYVETRSAS
jgi:hypothetical protein